MSTTPERSPADLARRFVEEGSAWRARDLLTEHVEHERDTEALTLLGQVLHDMGDLPRAGAAWFAAGAKGDEVDAAVAAWREQAGDDFVAMWRSLPAAMRKEPRARRIEALRERAQAAEAGQASSDEGPDAEADDLDAESDGFDGAWLIAWVLAVVFVVLAVIGFVTVLGWVVPG
ncbi:hypothetical protein [Oryzobacter telluris]|uniref:hypothetical protein n=1 Tax=Oryzobacter telluris TaxID=3149179 RepID=UPI00370D43DC